jgi:DME family drug/metabolite transporter
MARATKGYVIAIVGVAFWSSSAILISYLVGSCRMAPLQLAFWRDALVCSGVGAGLLATRRSPLQLPRAHVRFLAAYGVVLSLFNSIWTLAVKLDGAAVATVLVYSSAGFTALLARWLYAERLGLHKVGAVILSLSGCVLVSGAYNLHLWRLNPRGITAGLLSGLLFAIYSLMGRENERRHLDSWSSMLFSFGLAALLLSIYNQIPLLRANGIASSSPVPALPVQGWMGLITLAFIPTLLGYGLYNASMKYLPVSTANLLATSEPAMTAVQAYLLLGERWTALQLAGSALIIAAMVLVRIGEERRQTKRNRRTPRVVGQEGQDKEDA